MVDFIFSSTGLSLLGGFNLAAGLANLNYAGSKPFHWFQIVVGMLGTIASIIEYQP